MVLFRDIRERQKMRERPGNRNCVFDTHRSKQLAQFIDILGTPVSSGLCERPHSLHSVKEIFPGALAERPAEEVAQQMHVVSERFVRVLRHFPIIDMLLCSDPN